MAGVLCAISSGLMIVGVVLLEQSGRVKVPTILVTLGGASYSIYLVHYSVITLLSAALIRMHAPINDVTIALTAAVGVSAGCLFDKIIDRPAQNVLRHQVKSILFNRKRS